MDKKPEWSERPQGLSAGQMDAQELPAKNDRHETSMQRPHEMAGAAAEVPTRDSRWSQKLPIAILISGRGSNMRAIAERAATAQLPVDIRVVISDRASAAGLETAAAMGIETQVLSPRDFPDRPSYDTALARLVAKYEPKLIVLAGFMRILTPQFIGQFAGRILNIHPSLLPKYRGLHTHRRALEACDTLHGVSVHFVTEELDGGPVIMQACIDVGAADTEETLSARVQRQEHTIYSQAIDWFARGRLVLSDDRAVLDGKPLEQPVLIDARGT